MSATEDPDFVIYPPRAGRTEMTLRRWSPAAAEALEAGEADTLNLNYAHGFAEDHLEFLSDRLPIKRLYVLHRGITDLSPIERLGDTLEALSCEAAPRATLDLTAFTHLRELGTNWPMVASSFTATLAPLEEVRLAPYGESDCRPLRDHHSLRKLTLKDARYLESLDGLQDLPLSSLVIRLARRLHDISAIASLADTAQSLTFYRCAQIADIEAFEGLREVGDVELGDCREIASIAPLRTMTALEVCWLGGSTRILDNDLSPLLELPKLMEIAIYDRPSYKPRAAEIEALIAPRREAPGLGR